MQFVENDQPNKQALKLNVNPMIFSDISTQRFKNLLALSMVIMLFSCETAQMQEAGSDDPRTQKVDELFSQFDKEGTPGATVAIVQDGEIIYKQGYGLANMEYDIPNTPSTIFHIASVSKQFTCFAAMLLVEEGKISLNDDVRKYIPEVPDFGKTITLRHLANHTSGLRDQWNLLALGGWRLDDVITKEHVMKLVEKQEALNFDPGEEYYYCNTGYTLLAEVVSRVSGKSFAEFTQERIFEPLGMESTLFYDDHQKIVPNRAYSYGRNGRKYNKAVLSYANVGATSLFTTVEDLALWADNFEAATIGNANTMKEMHTQGILNNGDTISYALGQVIDKYRGFNRVQHSGGDAGYRTYIGRYPEQNFSVIVFSNFGNFNPGWKASQIADIYLEEHFTEPRTPFKSNISEEGEPLPMKGNLTDFEGTYYSPELSTSYEMKVKDGKLIAVHSRHSDIELDHRSGDQFNSSAWFFGRVTFTRNNRGQIDGYTVDSGRVRHLKFNKVD